MFINETDTSINHPLEASSLDYTNLQHNSITEEEQEHYYAAVEVDHYATEQSTVITVVEAVSNDPLGCDDYLQLLNNCDVTASCRDNATVLNTSYFDGKIVDSNDITVNTLLEQ